MEQSSIHRWRQQSVPHSGVREALLAPTAAPALPDVGRSIFLRRRSRSALSYIKNPTHQFQISP